MGLAQQFSIFIFWAVAFLQTISLSLFFWFSEMHNILIRYSLGRSLFRAQMLFCQIEHLGYFIHRFKFTHLNNKIINLSINWLNPEIIQSNTHKSTYTFARPTSAHTIKNRYTSTKTWWQHQLKLWRASPSFFIFCHSSSNPDTAAAAPTTLDLDLDKLLVKYTGSK